MGILAALLQQIRCIIRIGQSLIFHQMQCYGEPVPFRRLPGPLRKILPDRRIHRVPAPLCQRMITLKASDPWMNELCFDGFRRILRHNHYFPAALWKNGQFLRQKLRRCIPQPI